MVLRIASTEALREALTEAPREALKGRERHMLFHVIYYVKVHVRSIYAWYGKMNKRCLFTVFVFKNILLDSTLNPKFYIYISY